MKKPIHGNGLALTKTLFGDSNVKSKIANPLIINNFILASGAGIFVAKKALRAKTPEELERIADIRDEIVNSLIFNELEDFYTTFWETIERSQK